MWILVSNNVIVQDQKSIYLPTHPAPATIQIEEATARADHAVPLAWHSVSEHQNTTKLGSALDYLLIELSIFLIVVLSKVHKSKSSVVSVTAKRPVVSKMSAIL